MVNSGICRGGGGGLTPDHGRGGECKTWCTYVVYWNTWSVCKPEDLVWVNAGTSGAVFARHLAGVYSGTHDARVKKDASAHDALHIITR
jgi:hypothetical protein